MKKSNTHTKNGALILGLGNGAINFINQMNKMSQDPELKFSWRELFIAMGKGALIGGVAGYSIGWIKDTRNSKEVPMNLDKYLMGLSGSLMLNKESDEFNRLKNNTEEIIREFKSHFSSKLSGDLIPHGSTEKGTALNHSYDLDFAIQFKPRSFANNETMYYKTYSFFEERVGMFCITKIRKQKRSIGVCVEINDNEYWIDFAPYKLTRENGKSGYLFVNKKGWLIDNSTIQKTDISKLKKRFSEPQKRLIVILKDWKERESLPLPSHFLEHLVLDAYSRNKGYIPKKLTDKLVMILKHMVERLEVIYIQGAENSNNVISKSIDPVEKETIIQACKAVIREYEYQPNSLAKTFILC